VWPEGRRHIAVLILIPLVMAAINSNWLFTPIGYLDPWYDVGYFLHYGDAAFRTAHYKISRLSWLLPGWILYQVFRPVVANLLLHVGALLIATIFVYLTLARLVARDIALLSAVFLTVYYPFHGSGGWDYQTTGSGAYYALTLYFLTVAAQTQAPARSLFAAGMAFAATFHANIVFINMAPVLVGQYLVAGRDVQRPLARLFHAIGPVVAGFVVLTLALCVLNWSVGRYFLFFQPILDIVFNYVSDPNHMKAWWSAWSTGWILWQVGYWPAGAYYLAVPLATMLVGGWVLLRHRHGEWRDSAYRLPTFLIGQFIFLALLWIVWQSLGSVALEPDYFAYPLIIPCILGLAGIMASGEAPTSSAVNSWLLPATLVLALVPGADLLGHLFSSAQLLLLNRLPWVILFFVVAFLLVAAMTRGRTRPLLAVAMIALFQIYYPPFLEAALAYAGTGPFSAIRQRYSLTDRCALNRTAFEALITIDRLASEYSRPDRVWLWMGPPETASNTKGCGFNLASFRASANSLGLNALGSVTDKSPDDMIDAQIPTVGPRDWVALATTNPANAAALGERLRKVQRPVGPVQQREVMVGHTRLFLQLMPVIGKPADRP
jgi:hypothetical protein